MDTLASSNSGALTGFAWQALAVRPEEHFEAEVTTAKEPTGRVTWSCAKALDPS
jgi:hypothetical protein